MKYVSKAGPPRDYADWCNQVRGTENEDYRCLQNPEKRVLHDSLVTEQGGLCAYTMRRVDRGSSHIEHIKPESLCRADSVGSDLDYGNLVACFPRDGMAGMCRYGAQRKGDWWDNGGRDFVSPLHQNCERRFRFDLNGGIKAKRNHTSASKTIEVLQLDHESLTEDRRRVIHEFIYGKSGSDPLSAAKTKTSIEKICQRNADGQFYEFCVAIRDALREHSRNIEKRAAQRRHARRQ